MFSNKLKSIISIFLFSLFLFNGVFVQAQCTVPADDPRGLKTTASCFNVNVAQSGSSPELPDIIGQFVGVFLSFLGVLFFVLMVYGGFMWMTARGNTDQTGKAKKVIIDAILGLIIVLLAYAITSFITTQIAASVN